MSNPFENVVEEDEATAGLPPMKFEPALVTDAPAKPKQEVVITAPRVRIELADNENIPPTGLFLGADGVGYLLKANMPADVPACVVGILDTAVASVPIVDPVTMQITGFRDRLRFPYRVLAHIPAPEKQAA